MFTIAGLAAITAGCSCVYLASENQKCLASAWPRRVAWPSGGALLLAGWLGVAQEAHAVTATFVFATALMLVFSALPYIGALLHVRRAG